MSALSFDGFGINDGTEYRPRIATFVNSEGAEKYGALFAAAPALYEALQGCIDELELHESFARSNGDYDLIARLEAARAALEAAQ